MADDNYFDPISTATASPNLSQDDPLRAWVAQLQSDPDLPKLMATDPQAAIAKMQAAGIPPPPADLKQYTDGLGPENSIPGIKRQTMPGTYGGADPAPTPAAAPTPPFNPTPQAGSITERMYRLLGSTFGPSTAQASPEPVPVPMADPRKAAPAAPPVAPAAPATPPNYLDPLEPEVNPHPVAPGGVPLPTPNPTTPAAAAKPSTADALSGFSKSLQGVKPVAGPPPNFVGTPSVRSPGAISAPNLQALLGLVGQPAPSPLGMTLGRLLATGKA